jgi:hypothetical protein
MIRFASTTIVFLLNYFIHSLIEMSSKLLVNNVWNIGCKWNLKIFCFDFRNVPVIFAIFLFAVYGYRLLMTFSMDRIVSQNFAMYEWMKFCFIAIQIFAVLKQTSSSVNNERNLWLWWGYVNKWKSRTSKLHSLDSEHHKVYAAICTDLMINLLTC